MRPSNSLPPPPLLLVLFLALTLTLVSPSFAQGKARFVSERAGRLSDPITDDLGLALKIGFHSGCSGCLASDYDFNWCVHPDNEGVGACLPGDCSSYNYLTIFDVENNKRAIEQDASFKDGAHVCNRDREPEFRADGKSRVHFGVQDASTAYGRAREVSSLVVMTDGVYFNDVNTFSRSVTSNFCNIPDDTVIDRTQGGPDFLLNASYEHCLIANSETREILERECMPESKCFDDQRNPFIFGGKIRVKRSVEEIAFDASISNVTRFFYYQCDQLRMGGEEQRAHYEWILTSLRSVSCANDCHPYGETVSGVCQSTCARINEAYTNYRNTYGSYFGLFGEEALASHFEEVDDNVFQWILNDYVCVPDSTPSCQDVNLRDEVTDYFRSRISPSSMRDDEVELCEFATNIIFED